MFQPIAGGAGDWGLSYALTSFNDTKNNRRVQWGWAPEDIVGDGGVFSANQQGFQGSHTLPRELFVHEVSGVVNTGNGALTSNSESVLTQKFDGTFTASTLGVRPLTNVVTGLRNGSTQHSFPARTLDTSTTLMTNASDSLEIMATFLSTTGPCGLTIAASPDGQEYTTITYNPSNYTLVVDRSHSSLITEFNNASVVGYFYPYTLTPATGYGNVTQEPITMDVFLDGSLLEVYINERFALATRIYPSMLASTGVGLYVAEGASATVDAVDLWLNLYDVWPQRPANSSSQLVWDSAEQTNNYTWWSGN